MNLLLKAIRENGIFNPSDTRPRSGANADAMCLAATFKQAVDSLAIPLQRGAIGERCKMSNVVELETHAIRQAYNSANRAAILRLDFRRRLPLYPESSFGLLLRRLAYFALLS